MKSHFCDTRAVTLQKAALGRCVLRTHPQKDLSGHQFTMELCGQRSLKKRPKVWCWELQFEGKSVCR